MGVLHELERLGQSIWFDNISRSMLTSGSLRRMVEDGLLGVTSNPTIFDKAISGSSDYDNQLRMLLAGRPGIRVEEIIQELMAEDVRQAADDLRPVFDRTGGRDGYVSIEVSPAKARDTGATIQEARLLWKMINRPNLMVKIPATVEGLPAIEQAIAEGININVTLIFSLARYREVAGAYIRGLERRAKAGLPLAPVASVASVFVSRVDTLIDALLDRRAASDPAQAPRLASLKGQAAVANAKLIYRAFQEIVSDPGFEALRVLGAREQRPLWGSTSTKNPLYDPLLYVSTLVGPHTVNTVPPNTYTEILKSMKPASTIETDLPAASRVLASLEASGISMDAIMRQLEDEGVSAFEKSFDGLVRNLELKRQVFSR
jgi:transaldolase / glucose-6-phosphate isomerase